MRLGHGVVAAWLTFYYDDPSSNPAKVKLQYLRKIA